MLRMTQSVNASSAIAYFKNELSSGSYYTTDPLCVKGRWGGKAGKALGLEGEVKEQGFSSLCSNLHPETGSPLTPRTKQGRTVGYDITFNAPKSVTLAFELNGDDRLLEAFETSARETMERIESDARVRVRVDGKNEERLTGNLAWGAFTHFTSRPVDGVPDPHLHTHVYTFNLSYDHKEKRYKAAQFREINRQMPFYEADFHSRLAERVKALGYDLRPHGRFWEIDQFTPDTLAAFSRRTAQIEALASCQEDLSKAQKAQIGPQSREAKSTSFSMNELRQLWCRRKEEIEKTSAIAETKKPLKANQLPKFLGSTLSDHPSKQAAAALDFALRHELERKSIIQKERLLTAAMENHYGTFTLTDLENALTTRKDLITKDYQGRLFVTTKKVLQEEQRIIDFVKSGVNCHSAHSSLFSIEGRKLTDEQRGAVNHVLKSTDRVVAVAGRAGTGKTTMMKTAISALNLRMKKLDGVAVLAPTGETARTVLRKEGFKNADTVASFLASSRMQKRYRKGVIWVDEAGLLSTSEMLALFQTAKKLKCRVVLSGDTAQHNAVKRGDALRLLEKRSELNSFVMSEVHRQKNHLYKSAVEALARGDTALGFSLLEKQNAIVEIKSEQDRASNISNDYLEAIQKGETALVVSPTIAEGETITDSIREKLIEQSLLGKREHIFQRMNDLKLTTAQKQQRSSYVKGQVLSFHRSTTGFRSGDRATVIGAPVRGFVVAWDSKRLRFAVLRTGSERIAGSFSVNTTKEISLRKGDQIRFTNSSHTIGGRHKVNNRSSYRIIAIVGNQLVLNNGWRVDAKKGNFTYGYSSTSHSSQGKTVDRVFISQSTQPKKAASMQQFYVSVSRGRKSSRIYTDDANRLMRSVSRSNARITAHQMVHQNKLSSKTPVQQIEPELWH